MVVITFGEMLMFPLATGFAAERSTGRDQGMYMSWYAITYSLAAVIAPLMGSIIYESTPDLFWYLSNGIGLFVLIGFYFLSASVEKEKQQTRTDQADTTNMPSTVFTLPETMESD